MNELFTKYLLIYLALVNILAALVTVIDKLLSKTAKRRISEKTLIFLAAIGGSFSEYAVMLLIRHKTKHKKFMFGLPLIMIIQVLAGYFVFLSVLTNN